LSICIFQYLYNKLGSVAIDVWAVFGFTSHLDSGANLHLLVAAGRSLSTAAVSVRSCHSRWAVGVTQILQGSDVGVSQPELLGSWTFSIVQYSLDYQTMEKVQEPSNSDSCCMSSRSRVLLFHFAKNILQRAEDIKLQYTVTDFLKALSYGARNPRC
jgi:hypothetical protein